MELVLGISLAMGSEDDLDPAASDAALMAQFASGHGPAFEALYYRHRNSLYRYIVRLLPRKADAEEVFQEVWMAVVRGRDRYEPSARFSTFLFSIAHRRVMDRLRHAYRHPDSEIPETLRDPAPGPERLAEGAMLGQALRRALMELPLEQREAFLLRAEGGLAAGDIAAVTGVPHETAKSRLKYANRALRLKLEGWV
ncbi:MAG TPA: sigma-70 family RNA polymerase sigma factor [Rhizomicrobium sp.]|jgi:RNA polymerase sigma-70 factor (ECF subfamily)|nr:sigma-70 family RNA polymerase sigma factor [Rhizomicrobium sp.]